MKYCWVGVGWAVIALLLFVMIARRRGKFTEVQDLESMAYEQHTRELATHTPYAHMPLETENQYQTRRKQQRPVLTPNELALIPLMPISEYNG
ncbi:hypothetical protein EV175_004818 [Coemansia sp. RSA 1933]|nr:hypothetical protein EV175_004818 [Coemansia sp. RSA 1933]